MADFFLIVSRGGTQGKGNLAHFVKSQGFHFTTAGVITITSTSRPHTKFLLMSLLAMALRENFLISLRYIKNFSLRLLPAET